MLLVTFCTLRKLRKSDCRGMPNHINLKTFGFLFSFLSPCQKPQPLAPCDLWDGDRNENKKPKQKFLD